LPQPASGPLILLFWASRAPTPLALSDHALSLSIRSISDPVRVLSHPAVNIMLVCPMFCLIERLSIHLYRTVRVKCRALPPKSKNTIYGLIIRTKKFRQNSELVGSYWRGTTLSIAKYMVKNVTCNAERDLSAANTKGQFRERLDLHETPQRHVSSPALFLHH